MCEATLGGRRAEGGKGKISAPREGERGGKEKDANRYLLGSTPEGRKEGYPKESHGGKMERADEEVGGSWRATTRLRDLDPHRFAREGSKNRTICGGKDGAH